MRSIRRQLTLRLCVLAAVLLSCGLLAVYILARQLLVSQFDEILGAKAEALMSVAEADGDELEIDMDVQQFAGFGSAFSGDLFVVRRTNGEVVLRSPSIENQNFTLVDVPLRGEWRGAVVLPDGVEGRAAAFEFVPDGDRGEAFGYLQLVVASSSTALQAALRAVLMVLVVTGGVGVAASIVLIWLGLDRGLRPLDSLADEVQELKVDDPGLRLETKDLPKELRGIGEKLNRLLERVEASIARERRFSSHAAHELRTPLAELKIMAESVARWPDEGTPERSAEMLDVVREVEELLEKLSLLARADAGALALQIESVDLSASIERAIERESAEMKKRGIRMLTEIKAANFRTDPVLWQTILGNLLGNAVAYSPAGSTIHLEASAQSLVISNPAPNLTPGDIDLLFDRFWRKNTTRESGHSSHSGLGLAIVQSAVGLLGGACRAELETGKLRIVIVWDR